MAHFAELNDNLVINVIVVNNDVLDADNEEITGIDFLETIYGHRNFKQTSYNNRIRFNYAGEGYLYDPEANAFIAPQPFASWCLDNNYQWQAPKPMPKIGDWYWDESKLEWVNAETL